MNFGLNYAKEQKMADDIRRMVDWLIAVQGTPKQEKAEKALLAEISCYAP